MRIKWKMKNIFYIPKLFEKMYEIFIIPWQKKSRSFLNFNRTVKRIIFHRAYKFCHWENKTGENNFLVIKLRYFSRTRQWFKIHPRNVHDSGRQRISLYRKIIFWTITYGIINYTWIEVYDRGKLLIFSCVVKNISNIQEGFIDEASIIVAAAMMLAACC